MVFRCPNTYEHSDLFLSYRHRPVLGECLSSFAGCFPVAFIEPSLNKYNKYSILFGLEGKISEHSLEAQGIFQK